MCFRARATHKLTDRKPVLSYFVFGTSSPRCRRQYGGRNADKICVIEDGKVVESGPHDELIRINGGKYLQLVKLQLGGAINADGCVAAKRFF